MIDWDHGHPSSYGPANYIDLENNILELCAECFKFTYSTIKSKFFSERMFSYRGFSLLHGEHLLFCIFLDHFPKYFLLKLKLFGHNSYYNKNLLRNSPKKWQKRGHSLLQKYPFWYKFASTRSSQYNLYSRKFKLNQK